MKYNVYKLWKGRFCGSQSSTYCLEETFMLVLDHPQAHNYLKTGQKMQDHLLRDCLEQCGITCAVSYPSVCTLAIRWMLKILCAVV